MSAVLSPQSGPPIPSLPFPPNQHTFGHHSFTNDFDRDPDLHHFTLVRPHRRQAWDSINSLQAYRWYIYLQYAVVAFGEAVWIPIKLMLFQTLHGVLSVPHRGFGDLLAGLSHLAAYLFLVAYLPSLSLTGFKVVVFPLIYVSLCGILFGIFSQVRVHADVD